MSNWNCVTELVAEIKRSEAAGATMAAVCMAYVGIATMSRLSMPVASTKQTRKDFIAWVDAYLKGDVSQPYQYRGIDVYAARCAVLHTYGVDADLHQTDPSILRFGYHDGGRHAFDVAVDPGFIVIGTASFLNDVVHAISDFMNACQADSKPPFARRGSFAEHVADVFGCLLSIQDRVGRGHRLPFVFHKG